MSLTLILIATVSVLYPNVVVALAYHCVVRMFRFPLSVVWLTPMVACSVALSALNLLFTSISLVYLPMQRSDLRHFVH